ncbi:hypothetical protein FS842_006147 [Serendipita sp. 407]|nr:hypothetical protein FS842_006147 [Serendipita sp. 407]
MPPKRSPPVEQQDQRKFKRMKTRTQEKADEVSDESVDNGRPASDSSQDEDTNADVAKLESQVAFMLEMKLNEKNTIRPH